MFAVFKQVEDGHLTLDKNTKRLANEMIRYSSNRAATELFYLVGPAYIAKVVESPFYRLYQPREGGGLWVGKEYGKAPAWRREPMKNLSHAATALHVARFYYFLETSRLLSPGLTLEMKKAMADSALDHKFLRGLHRRFPEASMYRKSGSWKTYHSDSALVSHLGRRYILVSLAEDSQGAIWLENIIDSVHELVLSMPRNPALIARRSVPASSDEPLQPSDDVRHQSSVLAHSS